MKIARLKNPRDNSSEISIRPEGNETDAEVLAAMKQYKGTSFIYRENYCGIVTMLEVVIKEY
jgi:hypothetical protein